MLLFLFTRVSGQDISIVEVGKPYGNLPFAVFAEKLQQEKQIRLLFKEQWVEKIVTPQLTESVPLEKFLADFLPQNDLHYTQFQGNIILMPGKPEVQETSRQGSNVVVIGDPLNKGKFRKAVVSGTVLDGKTKTPIPGAQVFCEAQSKATSSDMNGHFRIELPAGQNKLKFTFIGLDDELRDVILYNDGEMEVELYEKTISLGQINVLAERPEDNYKSTSIGMVKLNMKSIKKLSVMMGEADVIKGMLMLPGVQSTGENAAGFNVRGGNSDQNLILVQDAPVFNTSHMFGLFSMLDPIVVNDVTLFKSGIPSRYGGRVSSVMDIDLKKGEAKKFKVNGGIGIINSRLSVEGPIIKDKLTFIAAARSTYSDWVLGLLKSYELQQSSVSFYDFNAKLDYNINSKNKLSVFGYGSNDYFNYYQNAEYGYGNLIGAAKWNHILSKYSSGALSVNYSKYNSDLVDFSTQNFEYKLNTSIEQEQLAYHFSTAILPRHKINAGFSVVRYYVEPGKSSPFSETSAAAYVDVENEHAIETGVYLEDEFDLTSELALIAGVRYSGFALLGASTVNTYADNSPINLTTVTGTKTYTNGDIVKYHQGIEPRVAFRYQLQKSSSLKVGYNRISQYVRQVSNSTSITPADYWKASDQFISPLISDQLSLGFFKNLKSNMYETSVELYYKNIHNEIDYKNGARLILNENIEQYLIMGRGRAYGAELMVKKNSGTLTGWLSYTYSRSFKKMDGKFAEEKVNDGNWYQSNYDKPHDLTLALSYKISRRFTASGNFVYSTGRPVTLPETKYKINDYEVIFFSDRNKYRLPDYHRLDLALTYEGSLLKHQKWRSSWTISVYNVYGRHNPFSVYYSKQDPAKENNYNSYGLYQFSVIGVPIPSFTYNFWF
jgi:hypothetical protein